MPGMMGWAGALVRFAFPWSSGTGGIWFLGWVWVQSGRFMPCFAIEITSRIVCAKGADL